MNQPENINFPSFSIIFETENLATVELENIYKSLASLAEQEIVPTRANEFLIIDGNYAPVEVIDQLCSVYPWITVKRFPGIGYYEAKMKGAALATGEIIVYCDSDCIYEPQWLKNVLTLFSQQSNINMVAGETATPIRNLYELAIAVHYFFPRFSDEKEPYISNQYFLNNIAFRRDFLLQNPILTDLPLYRGNCLLHAYYLSYMKGYKIWKHPQVRATHEPPTLSFISWRYLLRGRDRILRKSLQSDLSQNLPFTTKDQLLSTIEKLSLRQKIGGIVSILMQTRLLHLHQIQSVVQEDPRRLLLLPITIPYILWFELLYLSGSLVTYLEPNLILKLYESSGFEAN